MKKFVLHPAKFKLDGGAMFGIIPKPLWEKQIPADEHNRILMSLRVVFLQTQNRNILIDTGIGDYHSEKFQSQFDIKGESSALEKILKESFNIEANQITDIILTHLHFDHVGGLGRGGDDPVIFKNATIHVHESHYQYAQEPTLRDAGSFQDHYFLPLLKDYYAKNNLLQFCSGEAGTLIKDGGDEITFKTSFGHTPYMIHPIFENYIYMADLVPMSHHENFLGLWVMILSQGRQQFINKNFMI